MNSLIDFFSPRALVEPELDAESLLPINEKEVESRFDLDGIDHFRASDNPCGYCGSKEEKTWFCRAKRYLVSHPSHPDQALGKKRCVMHQDCLVSATATWWKKWFSSKEELAICPTPDCNFHFNKKTLDKIKQINGDNSTTEQLYTKAVFMALLIAVLAYSLFDFVSLSMQEENVSSERVGLKSVIAFLGMYTICGLSRYLINNIREESQILDRLGR